MSASSNKYGDSLNALFKHVYADKVENLIPENLFLYNEIKMLPQGKSPGLNYNQPVEVAA